MVADWPFNPDYMGGYPTWDEAWVAKCRLRQTTYLQYDCNASALYKLMTVDIWALAGMPTVDLNNPDVLKSYDGTSFWTSIEFAATKLCAKSEEEYQRSL